MTNLANTFTAHCPRAISTDGQFEERRRSAASTCAIYCWPVAGASETTHACMAGCTIRCSNIFAGEDGQEIVSPLEYETIGLMGANLGIDSLDMIAQMNCAGERSGAGLD